MVPRATLIAVLIGVEVALLVAMVNAVQGRGMSWIPVAMTGPDTVAGAPAGRRPRAYQFPAGAHPAVIVDAAGVDVVVETQAIPRINVTMHEERSGPFTGTPQEISAREEGGIVHVTSDDVQQTHVFGREQLTLQIVAPANTRITVTDAGDITLAGFRAATSLDSRDGAIDVRDFRGDLTASNSDGRIDVTDADCSTLEVSASNGRLVLTHVNAAQIDASSSNGRVIGTAVQLRDGRVSSSNGRVSLGFATGTDTTVTAATSNGRINVSGFSVAPASVKSGGNDSDSDDDDAPAAKTIRVGAGSGRLDVHTSNGSIDLSQEG
jgi:Putative adhesin